MIERPDRECRVLAVMLGSGRVDGAIRTDLDADRGAASDVPLVAAEQPAAHARRRCHAEVPHPTAELDLGWVVGPELTELATDT